MQAEFTPVGVYQHRGLHRGSTDCYGEPIVDSDEYLTNEIVAGDYVEVLWPDGTQERTQVGLSDSRMYLEELGKGRVTELQRAYVVINHHGVEVPVYLRDSGIKIRRVEE
jgi:hypothetical protein